ncbi:MAG TPA: hypothetical protein VHY83_02950 [Solirubrobacteraceae bacterium]|jgi:hypothetical protein|nr:hypothetical protein [Solirubrobacteraceae bacterium]
MTPPRPGRATLLLAGTLVLALGLVGFAVGRSMRTSKQQAHTAGRLAMARAFDASFQIAYSEADQRGLSRGQPEGEALGRRQGAALGLRHGELVKARLRLRMAARRRAREGRRVVHRPSAGGTPARVAPAHRRAPHRARHLAHRPRSREQREAERESRTGAGGEREEGFPEPRERASEREVLG